MNTQGATLDSTPGFADRVRSAVIWRWGSQVLSQIITWTTTILVVRLLDPTDYGLFAMTQAVLAALNFLNGYSFATSLIQAKEVDERRIGQVFGLLLVSNGFLAIAQFLFAPVAARYYGQPMVEDLLQVQSLLYLTTPFIALPTALLARGMNFRSQAMAQLVCAVVGAVVALTLASAGYGVWALVWAPIIMFAVRGIGLVITVGGLPKPIFDFRGSRDIIGFGTALTVCQLFWIVQSQSDIVIAGRDFSAHDLGLYSEALFLVLIFTARFLPPLNEVALPAFSELKNANKQIGPAFLTGVRMIMLVSAPFYVGLSLVAGPLVTTFFGPKWLQMIPIVAGVALIMPAMAMQIICSPATNAMGRPQIYLFTSVCGAIIMPVCFLVFSRFGLPGMVTAWHVGVPLMLAVTLAATLPAVGVSLGSLARALLPAAVSCFVMAGAVILARPLLTGLLPLVQLCALAGLGAGVYVATLWMLWRDVVLESLAMVRKRPASVPVPFDQTTTTPDDGAA